MSIDQSLQNLTSIITKRDAEYSGFIKHLLLMASSLLGFLIALHKVPSQLHHVRLAFAFALSLLSLGILFLTVALSVQLAVYRKQFLLQKEELLLQLRDPSYKPQPIAGNPSKVYRYCEIIGYVSLSLALICLTVYGILIA